MLELSLLGSIVLKVVASRVDYLRVAFVTKWVALVRFSLLPPLSVLLKCSSRLQQTEVWSRMLHRSCAITVCFIFPDLHLK